MLSKVKGCEWIGRKVLDDGVIANEYTSNDGENTVIINYTDEEVTVNGESVPAQSAAVIEGGVN